MIKDKEGFKKAFTRELIEMYGTNPEDTHREEQYMVLGNIVRSIASENWRITKEAMKEKETRKVYYFSMEFLLGRSLKNNLMNLGLYDMAEEGLRELGIDLNDLLETEDDAALGNGGLGRLAACFMDSAASLNYPVNGNCIRYQYGLFRQKINENGQQVEMPDMWLKIGNPWEVRRASDAVDVSFWGSVNVNCDEKGDLHFEQVNAVKVRAVPYDMPMIGANTPMTNTLRLWQAEPYESAPEGADYRKYLSDVNAICQNVYPDDSTEEGRYLRLKQQYFFVAAGINTIIKDHLKSHDNLDEIAKYAAIQLNDTHPVLAIPELMRVMMDDYGYPWEKAWEMTHGIVSYTNHTIMSEALEQWPCEYLERLLPRIYMIIQEIDRKFVTRLLEDHPGDNDLVYRTRPIVNGRVHMARLAVIASRKVNGVAAIHSEILKRDLFRDYNMIYPDRITNMTNGITPRRWMLYSNPQLRTLLNETIGNGYEKDMRELKKLRDYADDPTVQEKFLAVKRERKQILCDFILKETGEVVDPDSIIDVQAKRLHAYKRQLLNILYVISVYQHLITDPDYKIEPHTWLFAAKAAPSYTLAKQIIQLINCVGKVVNNDERVNKMMKVVFLPDYRVTMSEVLVCGTDISEQISMAGKEASGTGNMKFMMNGALTLGTLDGANVEIDELVGRENDEIFGLTVDEIPGVRNTYHAGSYYERDERIHRAVDSLIDGTWYNDRNAFRMIYEELLIHNDEYLVLADFDAYARAQENIVRKYQKRNEWAKSCLINIAESGYFSSDRTIHQYAKEIWEIEHLDFRESE